MKNKIMRTKSKNNNNNKNKYLNKMFKKKIIYNKDNQIIIKFRKYDWFILKFIEMKTKKREIKKKLSSLIYSII
jgi:hypothetical protein